MPNESLMKLRILLPFRVFATETGVSRIVADTDSGSMGILPRRMDFATSLAAGIFTYEIGNRGEAYLAVAGGILIKIGLDVFVSVRDAIGGTDLKKLNDTVERVYMAMDRRERDVRSVMSKMEGDFVSRIAAFSHE